MSEVKVNKISPRSGTDVQLGDSGDTITVPSGATFDASNATTTLPATVVTTDGSQTLTNKTIDASQLTDATVTPAKLAYNYNQFRNIIINGDMSIAQRGTSATGLGNGDFGYFTVDRWKFIESGAPTYEFTQTQDTDVPTGQGFATSLKMDCTTAQGSLAAADQLRISHLIEGQNLQYLKKGTSSAESLTVSFWVKSVKTGTYICELKDDNNRTISKSYTIDSASTWEKKTITFAGDTTGTIDNDNTAGLEISWWLVAGTTFSSGTLQTSWDSLTNANRAVGQVNLADNTANECYITGVQLEAGTTASDFEFLPVDVNLQRCYRYFQRFPAFDTSGNDFSVIGNGYNNSSTLAFANIEHYVPMRTKPTLSYSSLGGLRLHIGGTAKSITDLTVDSNISNPSISFTIFSSACSMAIKSSKINMLSSGT